VNDEFSLHPAWTKAAACRQVDPERFFPEKAANNDQAMRVCEDCPVRFECLRDALEQKDNPEGVWGCTTKRRRTILRKQAEKSSVDEVMEMIRAQAAKPTQTHCKRNHPFDEYNTRVYRGSRICRACQRQRRYGEVAV
jgi:WhiB family redox-sensing transcriptional regulator